MDFQIVKCRLRLVASGLSRVKGLGFRGLGFTVSGEIASLAFKAEGLHSNQTCCREAYYWDPPHNGHGRALVR